MGQYWVGTITNPKGTHTDVFEQRVGGEINGLKLMEHSWWRNPYVNSIAKIVYKNPARIAWVGDYAGDLDFYEIPENARFHLEDFGYENWYKDVYATTYKEVAAADNPQILEAISHIPETDSNEDQGIERPEFFTAYDGIADDPIDLDGKYLCNHNNREYIDLDEYYQNAKSSNGWVTNPLSLITAIGNGLGGGDFYKYSRGAEEIGRWALDLISIEDEAPKGYEKADTVFIED